VAEQIGRGFMTSQEQAINYRRHLGGSQSGQIAVARQHEVAGDIFPGLFGTRDNQLLRVAPERPHSARETTLFLLGRLSEHEKEAALGAGLYSRDVLVGNSEETEDNKRGYLPSKITDQVGTAADEIFLTETDNQFTDEGLHYGED